MQSSYITTSGIYRVFFRNVEPDKSFVALSLEYKQYIKRETLDEAYSLLPKGVDYCHTCQVELLRNASRYRRSKRLLL